MILQITIYYIFGYLAELGSKITMNLPRPGHVDNEVTAQGVRGIRPEDPEGAGQLCVRRAPAQHPQHSQGT